jgi:hypothetical protein
MMRRGAGFDTDRARRKPLEERQHVTSLEPATEDNIALRIGAVNLRDSLRYIQTFVVIACIFGPQIVALTVPTSMALTCRRGSRPQHHEQTSCRH